MATVVSTGTGALRFDELLMAFSMSMRGTGAFSVIAILLYFIL